MTSDRNRARTLFIVAAVVAAILAGTVLVRTRRDGQLSPAITSVVPVPTGAGQSELADPKIASADAARVGQSISVRSRVGLPMQKIYSSGADGIWKPIKLEAGRVDRAKLEGASLVCAPGHRSRTVDPTADEIVFDVDAMLVMRAPGLRQCVKQVQPYGLWEDFEPKDLGAPSNLACAGFLDDDSLGFAVARQLAPKEQIDEGTPFYLVYGSRADSVVLFRPRDGSTIEWTTECRGPLPKAPLVIRLDKGNVAKDSTFSVTVQEADSRSADTPVEQFFPWGSVQTWVHPWRESVRVVSGSNEAHMESVPEGNPLNVIVQDASSLAFATATFVHDGTPREIEIRPAFLLHGIVAADEGPLPKLMDVEWIQNDVHGGPSLWRTNSHRVRLERDGSFTIAGPRTIVGEAKSLDGIPRHAEVEIKAPGFLPSKRELLVTGVDRLESGDWPLVSQESDFVVLPGAEGTTVELGESNDLLAAHDGGTVQFARVARVVRGDDGRVKVTCFPSERSEYDVQPANPAEPLRTATHLAVCSRWHELRGFTRVEPGVFRAEPLQDYDLEIASGSGSRSLTVRLEWFGMHGADTRITTVEDAFVRQSWRAPSGSLSFQWRCSGFDPGWNSLPLDRPRQQFNLSPCPENESR